MNFLRGPGSGRSAGNTDVDFSVCIGEQLINSGIIHEHMCTFLGVSPVSADKLMEEQDLTKKGRVVADGDTESESRSGYYDDTNLLPKEGDQPDGRDLSASVDEREVPSLPGEKGVRLDLQKTCGESVLNETSRFVSDPSSDLRAVTPPPEPTVTPPPEPTLTPPPKPAVTNQPAAIISPHPAVGSLPGSNVTPPPVTPPPPSTQEPLFIRFAHRVSVFGWGIMGHMGRTSALLFAQNILCFVLLAVSKRH